MPTDAEITFADHAGRLYARRYGMAPVVGRLLGYLAICDPREQSIAELAEALLASRSAIAGAVKTLEQLGLVRRSRAAGERMDRVGIDLTSRRAVLLEWAAMAEWLVARLPEWEKDWQAHREALRAVGELPGDTTHP